MFGTYAHVSDADAGHSPAPGENIAGRSPSRTFPDMAQVLAGNTNAKTGQVPEGATERPGRVRRRADPDRELLLGVPSRSRATVGTAGSKTPAMHFRLTARDGVPAEAASATTT